MEKLLLALVLVLFATLLVVTLAKRQEAPRCETKVVTGDRTTCADRRVVKMT